MVLIKIREEALMVKIPWSKTTTKFVRLPRSSHSGPFSWGWRTQRCGHIHIAGEVLGCVRGLNHCLWMIDKWLSKNDKI